MTSRTHLLAHRFSWSGNFSLTNRFDNRAANANSAEFFAVKAHCASVVFAGSAVAHFVLDVTFFASVSFAPVSLGKSANLDCFVFSSSPSIPELDFFATFNSDAFFLWNFFTDAAFAFSAGPLAHSSHAETTSLLAFAFVVFDSADLLVGDATTRGL